MTISHRASTGISAGTTTTGGAFTLPTGHTTDDLLLAWLGVKAYTVGIASGTLTTDYTVRGNKTSGTVANGTGVGSTRVWAYSRTHDGSETAPACTLDAAPSPSMKAMSAYSKTNAGAWDIASATGADTSASGTSVSIASDTTLDLATGDVLVVLVALPDDTATMATSLALSATGITFGTITERLPTNGTTSGNDAAMHAFEAEVTAGSGTVTVTLSGTNTNSGESEAAAVFVRLREPAGGDADFTTVVGGEAAAGGSTSLSGDASFSTTASTDTASGGSTTFSTSTDATFTTTTSADGASGGSSTFTGDGAFATATSVDTSDGGSSSLTGTAVFSTSASADTASGGSSALSGNATFTTNAGGESAAGSSSSYTGDASFATNVSGDAASGGSTSFSGSGSPDATFDTVAGGETASGGSSSLTGVGLFSTVVAAATSDGGSTTATGTATFTTTVSIATADGGTGSMSGASPAVEWVGNGINATSGATVNVTLPTWAAGTTGVILVAAEAATNGNTCSTPTGYTYVTDFISNSSSRMYLFRKDMADGDSGATVALSWSGSNRIAGAAVVVKNATWDTFATQGSGSGSSIGVPTVTAGGSDGMTVALYGGRTDLGDVTTEFSAAPSGYSNAQGISTTAGGSVRNVLLGSAVLTFSSATVAATMATTTSALNSRAGIAVTLLGSALTSDGSLSTVVGSGTADGGSSTFTGSAGNGTFTTSVGTATADGNPTSFVTAVADATFWTTTTLSWVPPDTTGWTVRTVNATENPITLNDNTDYVIQFSATRTVTCDIKGGRNLVIRNPRIGGRKTAPALTSSYDGPNRGLRIQDGANANNDRTIWIEGLYVEPGTYQSDTIQVALRTENRVKIVIQNFNDLGINWGNNVTSPNVHADALQTYGGPTTLWVDGFYAAHCTYQGIIINPDDGRTAPTGTPETWYFRRVHLAGDNLTGNGVRYLLWNSLPAGWNIVQDDVYTTGSTRNVTDSSGNWPASSELRQQTQPPYDIVCQGLWDDNGIYTSPGYVTATASGGVTSFTNSPVATFSTVAGDAAAQSGGDTSFVASSPGTSVTFTTLADASTASGGTASWAVQSPQDAFFLSNVANATAAGSLGNLVPGVLLGYRVDLFIERPRTRLFGTYEGLTAYKKDGVWSITTSPQDDVLASADYVVRGGYDTVVSQAVGEELLGQGYGTLTPVYGP